MRNRNINWFGLTVGLVTTCIQRPPLFKDHLVMSQLWLYNAFFWPKRGRLIQASLYTGFTVYRLHCIQASLYCLIAT